MKKRIDIYIQAVKPYATDKDIKQLIIMQSVLLNMGFRVVIKKKTGEKK